MDQTRIEIAPKVWLDFRHAVYLEEHQLIAVADLHLGYTWAHRYRGQMLPFGGGDRLRERLDDLCSFYRPKRIALLGDIVHQAVPVNALEQELGSLLRQLAGVGETTLILGNHDQQLSTLLGRPDFSLQACLAIGNFRLIHGNATPEYEPGMTIVMGHEHPAISLGDGILGAKFPCFLTSEFVIVLPAFSLWAAGTDIRDHKFMSPVARQTIFKQAVAICGEKLLPIALRDQ